MQGTRDAHTGLHIDAVMSYTHGAPILGVMPVNAMFSVGYRTPSSHGACALQDVIALSHQFSSVTLSKP